jgi:hypothetical protein
LAPSRFESDPRGQPRENSHHSCRLIMPTKHTGDAPGLVDRFPFTYVSSPLSSQNAEAHYTVGSNTRRRMPMELHLSEIEVVGSNPTCSIPTSSGVATQRSRGSSSVAERVNVSSLLSPPPFKPYARGMPAGLQGEHPETGGSRFNPEWPKRHSSNRLATLVRRRQHTRQMPVELHDTEGCGCKSHPSQKDGSSNLRALAMFHQNFVAAPKQIRQANAGTDYIPQP